MRVVFRRGCHFYNKLPITIIPATNRARYPMLGKLALAAAGYWAVFCKFGRLNINLCAKPTLLCRTEEKHAVSAVGHQIGWKIQKWCGRRFPPKLNHKETRPRSNLGDLILHEAVVKFYWSYSARQPEFLQGQRIKCDKLQYRVWAFPGNNSMG